MSEVILGCCGFPRRKAEYFRHFGAVELQSTFYRLPQERTAARWREEAPQGFVFTLKAWQAITHPPSSPTYRRARWTPPPEEREAYGFFRPTRQVFAAWEATRRIAVLLEAPVVVFQCPPSFRPTPENVANLRAFFTQVERGNLTFVWEPRGEWPRDLVARLCRELDLVHGVDPLEQPPTTSGTAYFRLHGRARGRGRYAYRHQYTDEELDALLRCCQGFTQVYVFFNNAFMWEDALRFQTRLRASG